MSRFYFPFHSYKLNAYVIRERIGDSKAFAYRGEVVRCAGGWVAQNGAISRQGRTRTIAAARLLAALQDR